MPDAFDRILGQPQVRSFLRAITRQESVSHAYLFTGPAGSNKTLAAYALAQTIICPDGGCGTCDACKRVMRRKHPDVHYLAPDGANGYLIEQIRQVVDQIERAPIRASHKVYIIDRVDLLGVQSANAFLKTLEEPPEDTVLILLGRTRDAVLPTIVSRCSVVPFRHIPASEACGIVQQNTGVDKLRAQIAIEACDGSISRAIEFARSTERMEFRREIMSIMEGLRIADDLDILTGVEELLKRAQAPLDLVRTRQQEDMAESADFLAKAAQKQVEQRNKRQLSAQSRENLRQVTSVMRTWLRDVLAVCNGVEELVLNTDEIEAIREAAAHTDTPNVVRALYAASEASESFAYNVSPETCLDSLLFTIREVLYGSHSTGKVAI